MLFRRKEDVKVVGVFVHVEEHGLRVATVVADTLNGRRVKVPAVQAWTLVVLVFMIERDRRLKRHHYFN